MSVSKYQNRKGKTVYEVDVREIGPDGKTHRQRRKGIPTKEMAIRLETQFKSNAVEGKFFEEAKGLNSTVRELWEGYVPVAERNASFATEKGRIKNILRHLGHEVARKLNRADVERYRSNRTKEITVRGTPPKDTTLDREFELLKRTLNFAVECGRLRSNPLADVKMLGADNVRKAVIDEETFNLLLAKVPAELQGIYTLAFDTGMRKREILDLQWHQVDEAAGAIRLQCVDTKEKSNRTIFLTRRCLDVLKFIQVRSIHGWVFPNAKTGKPYQDIKKSMKSAAKAIGRPELWFHDLRRSFVTKMRRIEVSESVVMKMSGHSTAHVFKRYNVIEESDLRAAIGQLNQHIERVAANDEGGSTPSRFAPRKVSGSEN